MHEWTDLSRGRALALVTARDPREFPVGVFQRDPVPPPHQGLGTFTWFADHAEAADFIGGVVPRLLLDPDSWPDYDELVAETTRIARLVPDTGADPLVTIRSLGPTWGARADFVWWGEFAEIESVSSDFGRLVRMEYADHFGLDDDAELDQEQLVGFLRAYPY